MNSYKTSHCHGRYLIYHNQYFVVGAIKKCNTVAAAGPSILYHGGRGGDARGWAWREYEGQQRGAKTPTKYDGQLRNARQN
jgi:hypothetical protein